MPKRFILAQIGAVFVWGPVVLLFLWQDGWMFK